MKFADLRNPCLLVAMPQLLDPNFRRAVVLIVDHSPEGAVGFVLNRQSQLKLNGILADHVVDANDPIPVWTGGPVMNPNGVILHSEEPHAGDTVVAPRVSISTDKSLIEKYVKYYSGKDIAAATEFPFRFFVGYSGWGAGQLDQELRCGAWIQAGIDREIIFGVPEDAMWTSCLRAIGIKDENALLNPTSDFLN